jgi:hypothetical protein
MLLFIHAFLLKFSTAGFVPVANDFMQMFSCHYLTVHPGCQVLKIFNGHINDILLQ